MHIKNLRKILVSILTTACLLHGLARPSSAASYTSYVYDEMNRVIAVFLDSTNTNWIEYTYDQLGNLTDKIPHGNIVLITPTVTVNSVLRTPTDNTGGSIFPSGRVTYFVGSTGSFNVYPASGYLIAKITADTTIYGPILSGGYSIPFASVNQSLAVDFEPNQNTVTFTAGSNGSVDSTSQTVSYADSTSAVTATPANGYQFVNWTGTGGFTTTNNPLTLTNVTAAQNVTANFSINGCALKPVRIARTIPLYFDTLQAAYNASVTGDVIQAQTMTFVENLTANLPISVSITGGYACDYSSNAVVSIIKGAPQTSAGSLTLGNFIISN